MSDQHQMLPDSDLEQLAAAGDRDAFGVLYERHCDRIHDFLLRMVHDPQDAADLTQDTFVRAMRSISAERAGTASFSTWLYTISRHLALNRLERRGRTEPLADGGELDDNAYARIDPSRLDRPEDAAEAVELAALVWDAAEALEPRQRTILELHVRHGLDSAEIAAVLGVTKGNAYTLVSRLKDSFESAVAGLIMFRVGRRRCSVLDQMLVKRGATQFSTAVRRLVQGHVEGCPTCRGERQQLVSASAILRALVILAVPAALRSRMAEAAWSAYAQPALVGASGGDSPSAGDSKATHESAAGEEPPEGGTSQPTDAPDAPQRGHGRRRLLALASIAALFLGSVGGVASYRYLDGAGEAGAIPLVMVATSTSTSSPTPSPSPSSTPSPSPAPSGTPTSAPPAPTATPEEPQPTPTPPPPLVRDVAPMVDVQCDGFWARQPTTGAGLNAPFEAVMTALENNDRGTQGLPSLIPNAKLYGVAAAQAEYLVDVAWNQPNAHWSPAGPTGPDRLYNAGLLDDKTTAQHIDEEAWTYQTAAENVFRGDGNNPCDWSERAELGHRNNWRGTAVVDGTIEVHPLVYVGTACYVSYPSRRFACVQDFVFRVGS